MHEPYAPFGDPGARPLPALIVAEGAAPPRRWLLLGSLSGRLLLFTIGFALTAQIAVYAPTVAARHQELLESRIAAAQTAVLAVEATDNNEVSPQLKQELLANAGVRAVSLKREESRLLILAEAVPSQVDQLYDLRSRGFLEGIGDAFVALAESGNRVLRIVDIPRVGDGQYIEAVVDERPIHDALVEFAWRTFLVSLGIALVTGLLVFLTLNLVLVRPMQRLIRSMTAFSTRPDDASAVLQPSGRRDEMGAAETALAGMQSEVRSALSQRAHLAAMGAAVAKINHDLRNMLAGAQVASERLDQSRDPDVRRMAPRLLRTLDRAIALATDTLAYGRAGERAPVRETIELRGVVQEVAAASGALDKSRVQFCNDIAKGTKVCADGEQLYRILLNLTRNAVQAIEATGAPGRLSVTAAAGASDCQIDVADEGTGIPDAMLPHLFEAFGGGVKTVGTGLGLSIARELARNHGGDLTLLRTGGDGTTFRVTLPDAKSAR